MITENLNAIRATLPPSVALVAVSKTKPVEDLMEAYAAGQRDFGENYPLELRDKHATLPADIRWHFLGHIQSKQIKYYIDFVSLIHGVDSTEHMAAINDAAAKAGRVVDVLLEYHIATEATKAGLSADEAEALLATRNSYKNVRIRGVMGMATHTTDEVQVHSEFAYLRSIFSTVKRAHFATEDYFDTISMGMSGDYQIAIAEGSTMVRVGSSIFGARIYKSQQ